MALSKYGETTKNPKLIKVIGVLARGKVFHTVKIAIETHYWIDSVLGAEKMR